MNCVGIISFFPDNIRVERRQRLNALVNQLNKYFKLPIMIIAQNWVQEDIESLRKFKNQQISIYMYPKLGITNARIILREYFLKSDYEYLIMFDDDMELVDDEATVNAWLSQINDKDFYYTPTFLTNFCAISKEAFKKVNYDVEVEAIKGNGFEDWIFVERCLNKLNCEPFNVYLPARTRQGFLNDDLTTWDPHDPRLKRINEINSFQKIQRIRQGQDGYN